MNATKSVAVKRGFLLVVPLFALMHGCGLTTPPEAVLAGTWSLVPANATVPPIKTLLLTFDSNGKCTTVEYQIGNKGTVTQTINNGLSTLSGTNVTVSADIALGGTIAFNGTLNNTNTVATGNISTILTSGSTPVTIDNGPATMTKQ